MDVFEIIMSPFVFIIKYIFLFSYNLSGDYGVAIVLLSLFISLILLPIFIFIEKAKKKDDTIKQRMKPLVEEIKACYKGQERYYYLKTLNRQHNYSPTRALIPVLSLLIQIPFFIAAYQFLEHYSPLIGQSFLFINDLSKADSFMGAINILPVLMTIVNLVTVYFYTINGEKKERNQMIVIAAVFLIMLYNLPSALLLYWTLNNVFSFFRLFITNPEVFKIKRTLTVNTQVIELEMSSFKERLIASLKIFYILAIAFVIIQVNWALNHTYDLFALRIGLALLISIVLYIIYILFQEQIKKSIISIINIKIEPRVYLSLLFFAAYFHMSSIFFYQEMNKSLDFVSLLFLIPIELIAIGYYLRDLKTLRYKSFSLLLVLPLIILQFSNTLGILQLADKLLTVYEIGYSMENSFLFTFRSVGIIVTSVLFFFYQKQKKLQLFEISNYYLLFLLSALYIFGQIFIWGPLMSFSSFPEAFEFSAIDIIIKGAQYLAIVLILLLVVFFFLRKRTKLIMLITLLVIVFIAFFNNTLFPFDLGTLQVNRFSEEKNLDAPIIYFIVESLLILSSFFIFVWLLKRKKSTYIVYSLIVLNIVVATQSIVKSISSDKFFSSKNQVERVIEGELIINFSKTKKNIILLMPDMFQGLAMETIIEDNPNIVNEYTGFKWYRNTLSVSRVTNSTMPALIGGFDFVPNVLDKDTVHTIRQKMTTAMKSLIDKAHNNGFAVTMNKFPYTNIEEIGYDILLPRWNKEWDSYNYELGINSVKSDNSELIIETALLYCVPLVLKSLVYNEGSWLKSYFVKQEMHENSWMANSYNFLRLLPHISTTQNDQANLILLYSFNTHFPWNYVDNTGELHTNVSPLTTNRWTIETFAHWVKWMKKNGVYDNTKIIIVSDHGVPWHRYDGEIEVNFPFINTNEEKVSQEHLLSLNPLLLVKDFNEKGDMLIDNRFMSNADVNSIMFDEINPTNDSIVSRTLPAFIAWWAESIDKSKKFSYSYWYKVKDNVFDADNWTRLDKE